MIERITSSVVDSLKATPAILALLVMNLITVIAILWFGHHVNEGRTETINRLFELCGPRERGPQ